MALLYIIHLLLSVSQFSTISVEFLQLNVYLLFKRKKDVYIASNGQCLIKISTCTKPHSYTISWKGTSSAGCNGIVANIFSIHYE